jgi:bacterioferritin-associated ferredoxin
MYVCICAGVTDTEVRSAVACGARSTGCGSCHDHIDVFLLATEAPSELAA